MIGEASIAQSAFAQAASGEKKAVTSGEQLKLKGVVLKRDGGTFVLRDEERAVHGGLPEQAP